MMSGRSFSLMNITCQMVSMFLDSTHLHDKHGNCFLYLSVLKSSSTSSHGSLLLNQSQATSIYAEMCSSQVHCEERDREC